MTTATCVFFSLSLVSFFSSLSTLLSGRVPAAVDGDLLEVLDPGRGHALALQGLVEAVAVLGAENVARLREKWILRAVFTGGPAVFFTPEKMTFSPPPTCVRCALTFWPLIPSAVPPRRGP